MNVIKIGIVGGNQKAASLIDALSQLENVQLTGLCDINNQAPGVLLARKLRVPVYASYREMLSRGRLHLIFEVTGSRNVLDLLTREVPAETRVVEPMVASLIISLIDQMQESKGQAESYLQDIDNLVEELVTTNERLRELDKLKSDFISTVSHELRTPLTSILGFAKIITKKYNEGIVPQVMSQDKKVLRTVKQVRDNLGIIVTEGERLTKLINDVLDLAKMESGRVEWNIEALSLEEIVDRALSATSSLFQDKGLEVIRDIEENLPVVKGDRDRLIQVIINLLSNAVKFTEKGLVACQVRREGGQIRVIVKDTGEGIAPEDLEKVFEKFQQVGDTLVSKPEGTGLGLSICQQIVEHHGGKIWAESQPGQGSTFSFSLPLEEDMLEGLSSPRTISFQGLVKQLQEQASPHLSGRHIQQGGHILVVDDDNSIRELLRQELEAAGYQVSEARDGLEALHMVKKDLPGLVILDIMMPGMSGFDTAAMLKNDPLTMDVPILILSIIEDRERGFRIGVDRYLTKPVATDILLGEVEALLSKGGSSKKVMVIDEDLSSLEILGEVLENRGYKVVRANNGRDSIDQALQEKPEMIIIDALLSQREGILEALRFKKGMEDSLFILLGKDEYPESTG